MIDTMGGEIGGFRRILLRGDGKRGKGRGREGIEGVGRAGLGLRGRVGVWGKGPRVWIRTNVCGSGRMAEWQKEGGGYEGVQESNSLCVVWCR